jgi:hypothetical protein
MELEADNFFLNGDFQEKCIMEEKLRQMITQLELNVEKLVKSEKELSQSCSDEKKRKDREHQHKTRTKKQVLRAFQWEENTANPVLLCAVSKFWYALSGSTRSTEGAQ